MKDRELNIYKHPFAFILKSGIQLETIELAYTTYGKINKEKDNVIWVFHALADNADPSGWWKGLFDQGNILDAEAYFIVCVNMPGSCFGSTNPLSIDPRTGAPYHHQFPVISIRDMIRMYDVLRIHLGISQIFLGLGSSMGGMQAVEWAVEQPSLFKNLALIATNAQHSPWGIAFNTAQRMAIEADHTWQIRNEHAGLKGLKAAHAIALLSYGNYDLFGQTCNETVKAPMDELSAPGHYEEEQSVTCLNAFSYYVLSKSMDTHNVGRKRISAEIALGSIRARTIVIGIESDLLFPNEEQLYLSHHIPASSFHLINSPYGHNGSFIETHQLNKLISSFLTVKQNKYSYADE